MSKVLPILFNTDMVRAILDGRKTVTRRLIKPQPKFRLCYTFAGCNHGTWSYPSDTAHEFWGEEYRLPDCITDEDKKMFWKPPYHTDDILYVRETWKKAPNGYYYYEDWQKDDIADVTKWKPSIHMPKEAARIWLKVKDVRVERLQEITEEQAEAEGFDSKCSYEHRTWIGSPYDGGYESMCWAEGECHNPERWCDKSIPELFGIKLWNSTIKKSDLDRYGWDASPWVWVIEFDRCEKPEEI